MLTRDEIRARLRGPICSVPTIFDQHGHLDEAGVQRVIEVALTGGSRAIMLTWFDSLFPLLTDAEVYRLTQWVIETVAGRALVIAADRSWWTGQSKEFAQWCRSAGADLLMVKPPALGQATPDRLVEHYSAVADIIPVMLVGRVPSEVLPTLADQVPGIVAFKDDVGGNYGFQVARRYATRWQLITSGHLWEHLHLCPYGAVGWLSNFIIFAPQVDRAYWTALEQSDLQAAREVIFKYDEPWWDLAETFPGGADSLWHATLEVFGVAGRWRRLPYGAPDDTELAQLRAFYQQLGLL